MDQHELKANAKPFVTVDPAAQDGDLAVLGPMVGTASIVGLGEARALVEDQGMWVGGLLRQRFGLDPVKDVQVLCPMNRGGVGARSLNVELQKVLNPGGPDQPAIERFGSTYRVGDKVMQIVMDFDGRPVVYAFGELDEVMLSYAVSIHKSQGSEYPAVVIPVTTQHYAMLERNLLYTGVTRGKSLIVLVGQKKAVAIALRGVKNRQKWSKLREWLFDDILLIDDIGIAEILKRVDKKSLTAENWRAAVAPIVQLLPLALGGERRGADTLKANRIPDQGVGVLESPTFIAWPRTGPVFTGATPLASARSR